MSGPTRRERFVAQFADPPIAAKATENRLQIEVTLKQGQVPIGTLEDGASRGEIQGSQLTGLQCSPSVEGDLNRQQRTAFSMRLHRPADLRELPGEGSLQRPAIKAKQTPGSRNGAEPAGGCRAEEAKTCS